jgi:hypothetical protein
MEKQQLENMIDELHRQHQDDPHNETIMAEFNQHQLVYKELFKSWYTPAKQVELGIWETAIPMPVYHEDAYNHE